MEALKKKFVKGIILSVFVTACPAVLSSAEEPPKETVEQAYQNFLQKYVAEDAYYAIEQVGIDGYPVLLIGKGDRMDEDGDVLFTACYAYYYLNGQVVYREELGSVGEPLCIAEKDGQDYVKTSHNSHAVTFSIMKDNGWYYYEYESSPTVASGVTVQANGEFIACQDQYETYVGEYTEVGTICFVQNQVIAESEEETEPVVSAPPAAPVAPAPFYGIWCEAYVTYAEAAGRASALSAQYDYAFQVFLTTDWSNLNTVPYYCVTAGTYTTEEEAKAVLPTVWQFNGDAYVKYSGSWQG